MSWLIKGINLVNIRLLNNKGVTTTNRDVD